MTNDQFSVDGNLLQLESNALTSRQAQDVFAALNWYPYYQTHHAIRVADGGKAYDVLVVDVEPEIPQDTVHDIRSRETLALWFAHADPKYPKVQALRHDFPDVPHLNQTLANNPRELCLYDQPWSSVRLTWTGAGFLGEIAGWLAKTAVGELHEDDQPLEPFILTEAIGVVLPSKVFDEEKPADSCLVAIAVATDDEASRLTLIVQWLPIDEAQKTNRAFFCVCITGEVTTHGIMHSRPTNLMELDIVLRRAGIDLFAFLREQLIKTYSSRPRPRKEDGLIIITKLPRRRQETGDQELDEYWVFALESVDDAAIACGAFARSPEDGSISQLLSVNPDDESARTTAVEVMRPMSAMDAKFAATISGIRQDEIAIRVTLVGAGALGSQIHNNLARMGWGRWRMIDNDVFYPHNVVRHRLGDQAVGMSKTKALDLVTRAEVPYNVIDMQVPRSVLLHETDDAVMSALQDTDVIVDASTSIAVSRELAVNVESSARRMSVFLNPVGTDSVLLLEDAERHIRLDHLEAQYYRTVLRKDRLSSHIVENKPVRYSSGCRDVTGRIGQDDVAQQSGLLARRIRQKIVESEAFAGVWCSNADGSLEFVPVDVQNVETRTAGTWSVVVDDAVIDSCRIWREDRLPSETGGVILGYFDARRRTIYVVDVLPAPTDSVEYPETFIRGCKGLPEQMAAVLARTGGQVMYVGEWHSHPRSAAISMSNDDTVLLQAIAEHMKHDGWPGLIMILGDDSAFD